MTDLLLVLLINFFALYTTSQYLAVLKKEEDYGYYAKNGKELLLFEEEV